MTTSGPGIPSQSLFTQYFITLKEPRRTTKGRAFGFKILTNHSKYLYLKGKW